MKIVDRIVPEPPGGAHADPAAALQIVGDALEKELDSLEGKSAEKLLKQRAERFYAIGRSGLK
jgi:acetyl-CoA carboxylase carboxyl transferase subunit alpha